MPEMDGITSSKLIRELPQTSSTNPYIIACTADLQDGVREECTKAGINNYIGKPIKLKELRGVIEQAIKEIEPVPPL